MERSFRQYIGALDPLLKRLTGMQPVTIATLPKDAPDQCIYLFSEGGRHLYVGRTKRQSLRQRLHQHSADSSRHHDAPFAFKLAREATGNVRASYKPKGSRKALAADPKFKKAFANGKARVRNMELRYVAVEDSLMQTLLEIYAAFVLKTPYNDFDTH